MPRGVSIYDEARLQGRLLTPQSLAQQLRTSLHFWYSADFLTIDGSGLVSGAVDLTGQGNDGAQATSANRLTFFAADLMFEGRRSFGSTTSAGSRHLAPPASLLYQHQILSAYYKDGVDITFDVFSTFSAGTGSNSSPRILGNASTNALVTSSAYATTVSIGGRVASGTVLPLPASVIRADGNATFALQIGGATVQAGRVLVGGFRHFVGASAVLTSREIALIEGVIGWDDGTQGRLISTHPFANRPPLIGD